MNCYCLHLITLIQLPFFFLSTGLPNQQELVPLLSQGLGNPQHECQPEYQQMVVLYLSIFSFTYLCNTLTFALELEETVT